MDVWTLLTKVRVKLSITRENYHPKLANVLFATASKEESYVWKYGTYFIYVKVHSFKEN